MLVSAAIRRSQEELVGHLAQSVDHVLTNWRDYNRPDQKQALWDAWKHIRNTIDKLGGLRFVPRAVRTKCRLLKHRVKRKLRQV